ncbi:MAG: aminoacyl-tRNA hydrolase [Gemmataceae bacterium]
MRVIVGLGNPGKQYQGTRHNVGFSVIDSLAIGGGKFLNRFSALILERMEGDHKILLVKPETFMNLSGQCVRQLVDFYQLPLQDLLIVCDDVNLPLGKMRIRPRGSHGGHNGLRDIQTHLGSLDYARLRIGVGGCGPGELVDHVLGKFRPAEKSIIDNTQIQAAQAAMVWINQGIEICMSRYNLSSSNETS